MHLIAKQFGIHSRTVLIDTDTQSSSHLLTLCCSGIGMSQRTNLEYVRIIPSLAQSGMRENKSRRFLKTQQPLLVFKNKVVCRNIIRHTCLLLYLSVYNPVCFLVNREISAMHILSREAAYIIVIVLIPDFQLICSHTFIFLLEYLLELTFHLISVIIIALILSHFINKEKRKTLYAELEQPAFLLEMRKNCFPYLHPLHSFLTAVTYHLSTLYRNTVQESNIPLRIDFGHNKIIILGKS